VLQLFIDGLFKRSARASPVVVRNAAPAPFPEFGRYPPSPDGFPIVSCEHLVKNQEQLIRLIRMSVRFTDEERWKLLFDDAINRYAAFVHLLPASEYDHHRGVGGLFRHGLEVAHKTILLGYAHAQDMTNYPSHNRLLEQRWSYACFIAGLCHDLGKAVSDMTVTDRSGEHQWSPYSETLVEWANRLDIDRYYINYRPNRHKRHSAFSVKVFTHIARKEGEVFLSDVSDQLSQDVTDAVMGSSSSLANLVAYVSKADALSCEEDRKRNPSTDTGGAFTAAAPAHKFIFDAIRRCIEEKVWTPNDKNSPLFIINRGLYLIWPRAADDIIARITSPAGIPTNPETIAEMLEERGLIVSYSPQPDIKNTYWSILPDPLSANNRGLPLKAICFDRATRFYEVEPESVAASIFDPVEMSRHFKAGAKVGELPEPKARFEAIRSSFPVSGDSSPTTVPTRASPAPDPVDGQEPDTRLSTPRPPPATEAETFASTVAAVIPPTRPITPPDGLKGAPPPPPRTRVEIDPPQPTKTKKKATAQNQAAAPDGSGLHEPISMEDAIAAIEMQARSNLADIEPTNDFIPDFDFDFAQLSATPPVVPPTPRQPPVDRKLDPGASVPIKVRSTANDAMTNRMFFQRSEHLIGTTLLALAERINESGDAPERHLIGQLDSLICIQYPEGVSNLGLPTKTIVASLKDADWLTHTLTLGSIKDGAIFPKAIVLNAEISKRFLAVLTPGLVKATPDPAKTAEAVSRLRHTIKADTFVEPPRSDPPTPPPPAVMIRVGPAPSSETRADEKAEKAVATAVKKAERSLDEAGVKKQGKPKSSQEPVKAKVQPKTKVSEIAVFKASRKAMLATMRSLFVSSPELFPESDKKGYVTVDIAQLATAISAVNPSLATSQTVDDFVKAFHDMPTFRAIPPDSGVGNATHYFPVGILQIGGDPS